MVKLQKHIFLIGFMGVGKTTTSKELGIKLGVEERDTDAMIAAQEQRSISEIFEVSGEAYFRQAETRILDVLAEEAPCIVSCGGGMAMREENVAKMKKCGMVIFLKASPETIYSHVKDSTHRPLLNGNMNVPYIRQLMEEREPKYQAAADICIETDELMPEQVADKIVECCQSFC
ncbi:shikimate kinase [bacterium D16-51]|nr:shikimate kinase [bacterium D16-59]RKI57996.1 shikimate kinase [bacterium D16-51]